MLSIKAEKYLDEVIRISRLSAEGVLQIYNNSKNINIEMKEDGSPLTLADNLSHTILTRNLSKSFPEIPIGTKYGWDIDNFCWVYYKNKDVYPTFYAKKTN